MDQDGFPHIELTAYVSRSPRHQALRTAQAYTGAIVAFASRAESDRTSRKRFKSPGQAQRFLSAHDGINTLFQLRRSQVPAVQYRAARTQAFQVWAEVTGVAAEA